MIDQADPGVRKTNSRSAPSNSHAMQTATLAAIGVALLLTLLKTGAWLETGSVAMLASLVDSLLDVAAATFNWLAVRYALQPPDHDHRFGHGKAEPLGSLVQAMIIGGSAVFVATEAFDRLLTPEPISNGWIGITVLVVALGIGSALVVYQRRVARRSGSLVIEADALHGMGDAMVNIGAILAIIASTQLGLHSVDPIVGLIITAFLIWSAWRVSRRALGQLMDEEFDESERTRVLSIANAHTEVITVHDLRTRKSGTDRFVQLHIELDGRIPLLRAHAISDEVMWAIKGAFPNTDVLIHQDPSGYERPTSMEQT